MNSWSYPMIGRKTWKISVWTSKGIFVGSFPIAIFSKSLEWTFEYFLCTNCKNFGRSARITTGEIRERFTGKISGWNLGIASGKIFRAISVEITGVLLKLLKLPNGFPDRISWKVCRKSLALEFLD